MDRQELPPSPEEARRKRKMVFTVAERFALLAAFAQMGLRPPPETIGRVLANSYSYMKFVTSHDVSNLVQALHGWR